MAIQSTVIGNLGADAEQFNLGQSGTPALKFRVAAALPRRDKDGNKLVEWVTVIYFKTQLLPYLKKGAKIAAFGEMEAFPWVANAGQPNAGLQLIAHTIEFLGSKPEQQNYQQPQAQTQAQPQQQPAPQPQQDAMPFPPQQEPLPF